MVKLFEQKEEEVSSLNSIGTIGELIGKKGSVGFNTNNLGRADKALVLHLTNEKGQTAKVYASVAVGKAIREKQMNRANILALNVVEAKTSEGVDVYKAVMAQGEVVTFKGDVKAEAYVPAATTDLEELIAW